MVCGSKLVLFITTVAVTIADGKTTDELSLLGAAFTQLGDTLTTMATQQAFCESQKTAN
ncbi:MAG: hypothetical protein FWE69_06085 [Clostridiales bacterium]|nr:hypothetical protein [Clostridiales bacterium]